uniref:ethanolamine kinase n=1 Tax=Strigamia maritima TaxID=126957 RepID=T1JCT6_STRMM
MKSNLDISIKEPLIGIRNLMKHLRPEWKPEKIQMTFYTKGKVNTLIKCSEEKDSSDAVVIRIYKPEMSQFVDREAEILANQLIAQKNYSPTLLGIFNNGFCYDFINGQTVDIKLAKTKAVWKSIACGMATIHGIHKPTSSPKKSNLFKVLHNLIDLLPENLPDSVKNEQYKAYFPTKESLRKEIRELQFHLDQIKSSIVYCHGDPRLENILWNKKITFIDFEFTDYNYQAYDIAAHFNSYAGFTDDPDFSQCPDQTFQLKWLQEYIKQWNKNQNQDSKIPIDNVDMLYIQVRKFSLATHMMLGISGILGSALSTVDLFVYGMKRIEQYFQHKQQVFDLKSQ